MAIAEALAHVPGVYVVDDHVLPSVGVRGVTGGLRAGTRVVRVMIDGIQVNFRPDLTAFLGPEFIPIEAIERIEIAKGPLSALYGANAFLGTINVITRIPSKGLTAELGARVSVTKQWGYGSSGMVSHAGENLSFLAAVNTAKTDRSGLRLQKTYPEQNTQAEVFERTSQNDVSVPASTFLQLRAHAEKLGLVVVEGGLQRVDAMAEYQLNSVLTHQSRTAIENLWTNARWEREWSDFLSTSAMVGWSQGAPTRDAQLYLTGNKSSVFHPNYAYQAWTGAVSATFTPLPRFSLKVGLDLDRDDETVLYYTETFHSELGVSKPGDSVDVAIGPAEPRHRVLTNVGAYFQATGAPLPGLLPGLRLTGNLRVDRSVQGLTQIPTIFSWRAAAAYRFTDNLTAKLIVGRAFQTPSPVLQYAYPGFGAVGNVVGFEHVRGSSAPYLKPQEVNSAELVVSASLWSHWALETSIYVQELQDKIEFLRYGSDYRAANLGMGRNLGLEATLRHVQGRVSSFASCTLGARLIDGQVDTRPPPSYPTVFGTAGVEVDLPEAWLTANARLRWVSERGATLLNVRENDDKPYGLPAYAELNLTVSTLGLSLWKGGGETRVLGGVRNVFNVRYSEPGFSGSDVPALGREFFLELRQTF